MVAKLPKKTVWSHVSLVVVATVIAFALYYWLHDDGRTKGPFQQKKRVFRHEIVEKTIPTSSPRSDGDHSVHQGPTVYPRHRDVVSHPGQSLDQAADSGAKTTAQDMKMPAGTNRTDTEKIVPPEKPEYSDAEPPSVLSIWFEPREAQPGTNVMIYVQASDDLSGVESVFGKAKSPSGTALLAFECQASKENDVFVGVIEIPDSVETGTWSIANLQARDKVRNLRTYAENDPVLRTAHFAIIGADSDNTPPVIMAVSLDPREIRGGEKVYLSVEAHDDHSGVARIYGSLTSPSNNARFSISCSPTEQDHIFTGYATLPKDAESGEWSLYYVRTEDQARNAQMYYRNTHTELFEQATVQVYADRSDAQPPTLDDLTITPSVVSYGEDIEIVVAASDDVSGVNQVFGRLRSPSGKANIPFTCTRVGDSDTYRATVHIKNNSEVGVWKVEYIRTIDKARNDMIYGIQNTLVAGATLEVTGE